MKGERVSDLQTTGLRGRAPTPAAALCVPRTPLFVWACVLLTGLGLMVSPREARAELVSGKVTGFEKLLNPVWVEAKDPIHHGYSFRELVPTVPAQYRPLFPHIPKELCVAVLAASKQPKAKPVLVRVGGGRTTPVTIVVVPGTKLTFKNNDPFDHRLYAPGLETFSPSDTAQGATRQWTVPSEGVFEIRDELAPSVRMWVVGEPKVHAITYPSLSGDFQLNVEEPGDYSVQAYFTGAAVGKPFPVTVAGQDREIKTTLDVTPTKAPSKEKSPPKAQTKKKSQPKTQSKKASPPKAPSKKKSQPQLQGRKQSPPKMRTKKKTSTKTKAKKK